MRVPNYNLALLAVVCRCYEKVQESRVLMKDAADPHFADLEVPVDELVGLLESAGLSSIGYNARPREIPEAIQRLANQDHLVLVELNKLPTTRYKTWGVLEKSSDSETRVLTLSGAEGSERYPHPVSTYMTGAIVALRSPYPGSAGEAE